MPQYHKTTDRPAIFVSESKHMDNAIEVRSVGDMPPLRLWRMMRDFPPESVFDDDRFVYAFFSAFWPKKKVFYINIFPSGFEDGDLDFLDI